jgi:hypothetical protein
MSWLQAWIDLIVYLQINSEGFILFREIDQILLKISFIPILLTFIYQKTEL